MGTPLAQAQVTPDNTLGSEASQINPGFVNGSAADVIEGGAIRGSSVFHSFSDFNVGELQRLYFDNPAGIENILGRVTGSNGSEILGTLGVDGSANLYLLNPNGIVFGPDAQLDITGSFLASTADAFVFGNGDLYSAVNPDVPPVLVVDITPGLQFSTAQQNIMSEADLMVGQNLTLAGGTLNLTGPLSAGGNIILQSQGDATIGSIDLEAIDGTGSNVAIATGGNLTIREGSTILTNGTVSADGDPEGVGAGDITFTAAGDILIEERALLQARSEGAGSSGDIQMEGASLTLGNRAQIETSTLGTGPGGTIAIDVMGDITLAGTNTRILNLVEFGAVADGGTTQLTANTLNITNGAGIFNAVRGTGNSGDVILNIADTVTLDGSDAASNSGIVNSVYPGGVGDAGDINLVARSLILTDGGAIVTASLGTGNAGDINLKVSDNILIFGPAVDKTLPVEIVDPANSTVDVFFLADNTSSMSGIINAVKEGASALLNQVGGADLRFVGLDVAFGVGRYLADPGENDLSTVFNPIEFEDSYQLLQPIDANQAAAQAAIDGWSANNQVDGELISNPVFAEANFIALHQVATSGGPTNGIGSSDAGLGLGEDAATGWRPDARRVVIWFGDAASITSTVDLDEVIEALTTENVTVAAINTKNTGFGIDSSAQASEIVEETEGRLFNNVNTSNVTDIVLQAADEVIGIDFTVIDMPIGGFIPNLGRDPDLQLPGSVSGIYANTDLIADGRGGNIDIATDLLQVTESGVITGTILGNQDGGNLTINAGVVEVADQGQISNASILSTDSRPEGGDLTIIADRVTLQNNALITTGSVGGGDSGDLTIQATDSVTVETEGRITTDTGTVDAGLALLFPSSGAAGNLTIETRQLTTRDGQISASVGFNSRGQAGTLRIDAEDIDLGAIESINPGGLNVSTIGQASGGEIIVNTERLTISGGARIEAGTAGSAPGSDITVNATDFIRISGETETLTLKQLSDVWGVPVEVLENLNSDIENEIERFVRSGISSLAIPTDDNAFPELVEKFGLDSDGDGGNVSVTTGELIIEDRGEITSTAFGDGNAGNIEIIAGSGVIRESGRIISRSENQGFAGSIDLNIGAALETNGGEISASSDASGGNDITIAANTFRHGNGSLISSSVFDSIGGGGNITIQANAFAAVEDSDILANAQDGQGGDIFINSPAFLANLFTSGDAVPVGRNPGAFAPFRGNNRVDISADSAGGESGQTDLSSLFVSDGLNELPIEGVDPTDLIDQRCALLANQERQNHFVVEGRGGLPISPEHPLTETDLVEDLGPEILAVAVGSLGEEVEEAEGGEGVEAPEATTALPEIIQEPQAWVREADGTVYLYAEDSAGDRAPQTTAAFCATTETTSHRSHSQ